MATIEGIFNYVIAWIITFVNRFIPDYIIPNLQLIIQVIILLIVGYVAGKLGKVIITKILSAVGLKRITRRTWAESVIRITGYQGTIVELIGDIVKWIIYLVLLGVIIQTIGFPGVADIFTQTAAFMPRFIGAILIIVIGFIIADFFGKVFEEAGKKLFSDQIMGSLTGGVVRYSIAIIVIIMSLSLIGIDSVSLTVMFAIILSGFVAAVLIGTRNILPAFGSGMQMKDHIKVGDKIKIGEYSGIVEKIDPFSITIVSGKKSIIIPSKILSDSPIEKY